MGRFRLLRRGAFGLTIFVVLIELGLRLVVAPPNTFMRPSADPALLYELTPGVHSGSGYFIRIPRFEVTSELGCRIDPTAALEAESPVDLLFLGDSFTFGDGVDGKDAFPAVVGRRLGLAASTANCGVPGFNLEQLERAAELHIPRLRPRVVVLALYDNDMDGAMQLQRFMPTSAAGRFALAHSRLFKIALFLRAVQHEDTFTPPRLPDEVARRLLSHIEELTAASGGRLFVAALLRPDHPLLAQVRALQIPIALAPGELFAEHLYIPHHGHWSVEGNGVTADWLTPEIGGFLANPGWTKPAETEEPR